MNTYKKIFGVLNEKESTPEQRLNWFASAFVKKRIVKQ